jgi:hypothetical protein
MYRIDINANCTLRRFFYEMFRSWVSLTRLKIYQTIRRMEPLLNYFD